MLLVKIEQNLCIYRVSQKFVPLILNVLSLLIQTLFLYEISRGCLQYMYFSIEYMYSEFQ